MWTTILGLLGPTMAKAAMFFLDGYIRKNVKDRELTESWQQMMIQLQQKAFIKGSTPDEYANAGKAPQPPQQPPQA